MSMFRYFWLFIPIILFCSACNYPGLMILTTPTPSVLPFTPTFTITPQPTLEQSETPAPSDEPLLEPTPTLGQLILPPTIAPPTMTIAPTLAVINVTPRGKFVGSFNQGNFTLRVNEKGNMVVLKQLILKGIECKGGGKLTDSITFEGSSFFPIEANKFSIALSVVSISGRFTSPTSATGTISINYVSGEKKCQVGPLIWSANLSP